MTIEEEPDGPETIDEEALAAALREKGLDDHETAALLSRWADAAETEADAVGRGKGELAEQARANLEIRRAVLYSKSNLGEIANEAWTDAYNAVKATRSPALMARLQREASVFGYNF